MKNISLRWLIFVAVVSLLQFIYVYAFFIEPNWIKIERVRIVNPRLAAALSGIKIIQISDLHIEDMGFREVSLVEKINRIKPDIIFITGDMINAREGITPLWNILSLLEPKMRTYAVHGESDGVIGDLKEARQWDKTDTSLMDGKAVHLDLKNKEGSGFWLIGAYSSEELSALIADLPKKTDPIILISHRPDIVKQAALDRVDFVFCGHTHGGQVAIPLLSKIIPYAQKSVYSIGLYQVRDTLLYVNPGFASKKGLRFLRRPEITVFDFVSTGSGLKPQILDQDK